MQNRWHVIVKIAKVLNTSVVAKYKGKAGKVSILKTVESVGETREILFSAESGTIPYVHPRNRRLTTSMKLLHHTTEP